MNAPADSTPVQYTGQDPLEELQEHAADFAGGLRELYSCSGPCQGSKNHHKHLLKCNVCPLTKLSMIPFDDRSQPFSNPILIKGNPSTAMAFQTAQKAVRNHATNKWHPFWKAVHQLHRNVEPNLLTAEDEDRYVQKIIDKEVWKGNGKRQYLKVQAKFLTPCERENLPAGPPHPRQCLLDAAESNVQLFRQVDDVCNLYSLGRPRQHGGGGGEGGDGGGGGGAGGGAGGRRGGSAGGGAKVPEAHESGLEYGDSQADIANDNMAATLAAT